MSRLRPMKSPFPPGPTASERLQTIAALVGMAVLVVIVAMAAFQGGEGPAAEPSVDVRSEDRFGPPGSGPDKSRFYGPSDALEDLRDVEISEAEFRARWAELFETTVENIGRPVTGFVIVPDDDGAP